MKMKTGEWGGDRPCCAGCKTTARPHRAKGMCATCYDLRRRPPKENPKVKQSPKSLTPDERILWHLERFRAEGFGGRELYGKVSKVTRASVGRIESVVSGVPTTDNSSMRLPRDLSRAERIHRHYLRHLATGLEPRAAARRAAASMGTNMAETIEALSGFGIALPQPGSAPTGAGTLEERAAIIYGRAKAKGLPDHKAAHRVAASQNVTMHVAHERLACVGIYPARWTRVTKADPKPAQATVRPPRPSETAGREKRRERVEIASPKPVRPSNMQKTHIAPWTDDEPPAKMDDNGREALRRMPGYLEGGIWIDAKELHSKRT